VNAKEIFEPDRASLKGKTTKQADTQVTSWSTNLKHMCLA